jgi:hypothetical protein
MIIWDKTTTNQDILTVMTDFLKSDPFDQYKKILEIKVLHKPNFLQKHVLFEILKKQIVQYPRVIKLHTTNLSIFNEFKKNGFDIDLKMEEIKSKTDNTKTSNEEKKTSKTITNNNNNIFNKEQVPTLLKTPINKIEKVIQTIEAVTTDEKNIEEKDNHSLDLNNNLSQIKLSISQNKPSFKIVKEKDQVVKPDTNIVILNIYSTKVVVRPKNTLKLIINTQSKQIVKKELVTDQASQVDFASLTQALIDVSEPQSVRPEKLNISVDPRHLDTTLNNHNQYSFVYETSNESTKAKAEQIRDQLRDLNEAEFLKKEKNTTMKIKNDLDILIQNRRFGVLKNRALALSGIVLTTIFGLSLLTANLPPTAYAVEVDNQIKPVSTVIKLNKNKLSTKDLDLGIYLEKSLPKEQKEDLDYAKGQIVLYSKGINSCNITNGGFLVGVDGKNYNVKTSPNYNQTVTISPNSAENSTLIFDIEATARGDASNLDKGQILNLLANDGSNLSKNCFARTVDQVKNFIFKNSNSLTPDVVNSLKETANLANSEKINNSYKDLIDQGDYIEEGSLTKNEPLDSFDTKSGDKIDTIIMSRKLVKSVKYMSKHTLEAQINQSLPNYKVINNLKVIGSSCTLDDCSYEIKYEIVNAKINKDDIARLLEKSGDDNELIKKIKQDYPQIKDIKLKSGGINLPNIKKVKVE